jgi:transposase
LELTTGWSIGDKDATDDRLARVVEELGKQSQARQEIEIKLGRQIIRAYELPTEIARTDTTSFSVNHENQRESEENLLRYGYSKDKRPDLLQYRQLLATLDPMGMPLISATLEGNGADDPLYFPTWEKMVKVIGHKNFVFIADCKAGSMAKSASIAANPWILLCSFTHSFYKTPNFSNNGYSNHQQKALIFVYPDKKNKKLLLSRVLKSS